jgi:hypothetical protein
MRASKLTLLVLPLLAVPLAVAPAVAQSRKAFKTLNLVKQVDGAGSGLDGDTVRGLTPAHSRPRSRATRRPCAGSPPSSSSRRPLRRRRAGSARRSSAR